MRLAMCLLAASLAFGQPVSIDLAGDWRVQLGDDPAWASPAYDDRSWETLRLPFDGNPQKQNWIGPGAAGWLRRSFDVPPETTDRALVLTVGGFALDYQVFLNGVQVGEVPKPLLFPQARLFDLPPGSVRAGAKNVIALRKFPWRSLQGGRTVLPNAGPFLITDQQNAPRYAPELDYERRIRRITPSYGMALVFGILALILTVLWFGEVRRIEFLLLAALLAFEAFSRANEYFSILFSAPSERSFASGRVGLELLFGLTVLGIRLPVWGWLVVVCAQTALLWSQPQRELLATLLLSMALLLVVLIAQRWKNLEDARALTFCGPLLVLLDFAGNPSPSFRLASTADVWGLYFRSYDIVKVLLAVVLIVLLVRRLIHDRQEKRRLSAELEAARTVQQLLVSSAVDGVDAVYLPAQQVGGDFYWSRVNDDGSLIVVVGDVSGKGLKAAMLVSVAIGCLRTMPSDGPAAILTGLNRALAHSVDGGFVTACAALIRPHGSQATLANAGHPAPYLDGQELDLPAGLPLGLTADADYSETTIPLTGGPLTLLSDGVPEAANPKTGELFGFPRTAALSTKPAHEIAEAARAWGQTDDITVVTIHQRSAAAA